MWGNYTIDYSNRHHNVLGVVLSFEFINVVEWKAQVLLGLMMSTLECSCEVYIIGGNNNREPFLLYNYITVRYPGTLWYLCINGYVYINLTIFILLNSLGYIPITMPQDLTIL